MIPNLNSNLIIRIFNEKVFYKSNLFLFRNSLVIYKLFRHNLAFMFISIAKF